MPCWHLRRRFNEARGRSAGRVARIFPPQVSSYSLLPCIPSPLPSIAAASHLNVKFAAHLKEAEPQVGKLHDRIECTPSPSIRCCLTSSSCRCLAVGGRSAGSPPPLVLSSRGLEARSATRRPWREPACSGAKFLRRSMAGSRPRASSMTGIFIQLRSRARLRRTSEKKASGFLTLSDATADVAPAGALSSRSALKSLKCAFVVGQPTS